MPGPSLSSFVSSTAWPSGPPRRNQDVCKSNQSSVSLPKQALKSMLSTEISIHFSRCLQNFGIVRLKNFSIQMLGKATETIGTSFARWKVPSGRTKKGGEILLVHTLLFEGEVEGKSSGGPPAPGGELQSSSGRIMQ